MDTACDTGDPMDEDASNSDETNSDASDEVSIFNSDHADTQVLNNAGTTAPDDANANTNINADADTETDTNTDTNTDTDTDTNTLNETDTHILNADYNRFHSPNSCSPTPPEEEDDHGPVESGPLMNEVCLAHKRGKGSPPRKICFLMLFTASAQEYPRSLGALGLKISQHNLLDLTRRFLYYQLNPSLTIDPDNLPLAVCPVIWDSKVSVFYLATATFCAPSNPSGPGGMCRKAIHSTHYWSRGNIPGLHHECVFVDVGNPGVGMQGLLVARVYLFFKFPYGSVKYPCTLMCWYSTSNEWDPSTHLSLGARVPGFWWEHAEYIAGIETLCPAFAQQDHPVHIWNVIWLCVPNVPISNISFTAGMRPCYVSEMCPSRTFQVLSVHVHKMFPAYAQQACYGYMHFV